MPLGVILAILSYSIYSCGDAIVKSFSGQLSVFEIGFFANAFALVPAIFAKRPGEHWRQAFKLSHPWLLLRSSMLTPTMPSASRCVASACMRSIASSRAS